MEENRSLLGKNWPYTSIQDIRYRRHSDGRVYGYIPSHSLKHELARAQAQAQARRCACVIKALASDDECEDNASVSGGNYYVDMWKKQELFLNIVDLLHGWESSEIPASEVPGLSPDFETLAPMCNQTEKSLGKRSRSCREKKKRNKKSDKGERVVVDRPVLRKEVTNGNKDTSVSEETYEGCEVAVNYDVADEDNNHLILLDDHPNLPDFDVAVQDCDKEEEVAGDWKRSNGTITVEWTCEGADVVVKRITSAHNDVVEKETNLLNALDNHLNVIHYHGQECDRDYIYLSVERCHCNLHEFVQKQIYSDWWKPNGHPSSTLLELMKGIVAALAKLHGSGFTHGDLKPHNVLIFKRESLYVKLSNRRPIATGSGCGPQTQAMDMFSLAQVLYFCLTRGGYLLGDHFECDINETNEDTMDLFLVEQNYEAMDLFSQLLYPSPELRLTASEVLCHPLFWTSEKRMLFLSDTSGKLESEDPDSVVSRALKNIGSVVFHGRWDSKIKRTFLDHMEEHRPRKYCYNTVQGLLRIVRNTMSHHSEFPDEFQELVGSSTEGIDDYFCSRFPNLFMEVYKVMYRHCKQKKWFQKYLIS